MKSFATTLDPGTSRANLTGSWRTERPVYIKRLPPCNKACPAGENIQAWLAHAETGDIRSAWQEIVKNNPFPATMGRVCYHPCESACNRMIVDSAVNINAVEQFIGDEAIRQGWHFEKPATTSGKRMLVIGAGPAGLSAAYHLARLGHQVTIQDTSTAAGGMMRYGIPSYRLPRSVLDAEIQRIVDLGITLELNTKVPNVLAAMTEGKFDAVFMAIGAHVAKTAPISSSGSATILDAVSVLRSMETDNKPSFGERVVVYGGGNTALDVARTALRSGAKKTAIVYRRDREHMPAHDFEVDEALEEGITIKWLTTIKSIKDGTLTCEKMTLDDKGLPQPTGKLEKMKADCTVLAVGQDADLALIENASDIVVANNLVTVDEGMMTGHAGIFAGGDMVSSTRTVTTAIGHGKKAARRIDAWLNNREESAATPDVADSRYLNTWYYDQAVRAERAKIPVSRRKTSFDEVQKGLVGDDAVNEARRCLSCGNCFECDNCYGVCPDNAIQKLGEGKGFAINYDYCKGCGICVAECPCGALTMVPEEI